mgnify:CR=1 FL=1
METWKIKNVCNQAVKLVISTSQRSSVGLKLEPGEFVISLPKQTPAMDAQMRRQVINVDRKFNNEMYEFEMGRTYSQTEFDEKEMEIAAKKAEQYINKDKIE